MRTCPVCTQPLRWDEDLRLIDLSESPEPSESTLGGCVFVAASAAPPTRQTWACPRCHASAADQPPPEPRRYPVGSRIPSHPNGMDMDLPICGMCRRALFEDDRGQLMRLREPELDEADIAAGIRPMDAFHSCRDCIAKYRSRKMTYLKRLCGECGELDCTLPDHAPLLPEGASERKLTRNMLT